MAEILYNEIYPKGATTKNIVAKSKDVKYAKAGTTIVYDTFKEYTYGTPVITVEYKTVLSRNGGSIKPTVTYSQTRTKRGYSERAYESETISGTVESFTATGKILNSSEATIDTSNGTVSRDSLGTTYKSATWNIMEVTVTATINGVSASGTGIAKMQSNTYTDSGGVTTYSDVVKGSITNGYIPAFGGEATATATAGSQDWYTSEVVRTFQTTSTKVITAAKSGTNTINGTTLTVSKDSKGTDISNVTVAGTKTVTWTGQGNKSATGTLYVYQNANYVTELTLSGGGLAYDTFTAAGTTKTPKTSTSKTVTFKFTSGSTTTTIPGSTYGSLSRAVSYGMTTATGFTLNSSSTGSITASNNKSTSARSTTAYRYEKATWTPSSSYPDANTINSSQGSNSCTISQSKGYYSYNSWSVSISASPTSGISAAGGSSTVTASASRTYGWNGATSGVGTQNGTVTLSIPATTGASLSGNVLTWEANTSTTSERSVNVTATCKEDTSKTKSVTIKQNKDTISYYNTPTFDMWWSSGAGNNGTPVSAAGGTSAAPTYSVSQTATYVSGTVRSVTPSITSAVFSLNDNTTVSTAEVNSSTGAVTFGSAGTSEQGKEHVEVLLTLVSHGKTGTDIGWCYQAANTKSIKGGVTTYGAVTAGTITNKTIPAGGTTTNYTATAGNGSQTYSTTRKYYLYTSGSEETITNAASGSVAVAPSHASISATASTKGTTISEANVVKSQTVTWASLDGSASKNKTSTMYIYQAANYVTSVSPQVISSSYDHFYYSGSVAASGGYKDPIGNGASTLTFSSGSTYYSSSAGSHCGGTISYSRSYSLPTTTGASINSSGRVTWTANTSTSKRSATVSSTLTVTYTHPSGINNGKTVSRTLNGTATCSQNADSITNSTVSYSGLKCTLTNNLTASGGSATVKVTTLKITTHTWASGKNPTYEYVNYYDVTSSATKTIDHATLFNTSGAVIEASTRFSISGATVSHSSMLDKVGIDGICVKAVFSGMTSYSDYAEVQNSRTDKKELTNVSVSYANASYVGGVNIAPSKSATYKVTPTYTSGFSGTTTTSTVTPNIDSYSITGTGCSKGSTTGYIIWSANPNTASRSATITGTVAHQGITSSFSTTAWQVAKPVNIQGCKVTFVNKTSCVAQITFTNCETSFVSIPPNSTQYYTLIKAQGVSGSVIYASVSTPGTCTLRLSTTGFYCTSPHTSTTCNITT